MKSLRRAVLSILVLAWISYAQDAAPPGNQSSYPSETHKMTQKEKRRTAIGKGMPVDLNTASKQDIAALPAVGPDYAQTIIDARPFASKESDSPIDIRQNSEPGHCEPAEEEEEITPRLAFHISSSANMQLLTFRLFLCRNLRCALESPPENHPDKPAYGRADHTDPRRTEVPAHQVRRKRSRPVHRGAGDRHCPKSCQGNIFTQRDCTVGADVACS